jgi:hypothetical protein
VRLVSVWFGRSKAGELLCCAMQVVEVTWERDGKTGTGIDPTVYTGLLGTAFTCLRSYEVTGNEQDLLLCSEIVDTCSVSARTSSR